MTSFVRALGRLPLVDGWALAMLTWTLVFGVTLRAWRVVDGVWGAEQWSELWWAPKTFAVDMCFAVMVWAATVALLELGKTGARRIVARALCAVIAALVFTLGIANALSFHISGSALTVHRLRGEDGATMRDVGLIALADVWPVALLAVLTFLSLVVALFVLPRRVDRIAAPARARFLVAVLTLSVVGYVTYVLAWERNDRGYGRHPLGVLLESAMQDAAARPEALQSFVAPAVSDDGWRALFHPDEPTTPAPPAPVRASSKTKNVIVFFSEGVPLEHTSLAPNGPPTTPRLKARAERSGLVLDRFYSPYHRSIHALYSLLCGEYPTPNALGITALNPRIACDEWSTAFARAGMKPGFLHGGFFSFYDKGQFLNDRDYVVLEDAASFRDEHWLRTPWGIDDRAMVERALEWIDSLAPDDRFALVLVPITAHYPYTVPDDVKTPFGDSRKIDRYRGAIYFLDIVFDQLMTGLEQRGLLDDTLVLFTADHGESPHEPPRVTNVDRAAYEYNVHVPGVLFSTSMFPTPQHTERLASIADILPTMLDASGGSDVRERQGRSLLANDWQERRVFLGAARSNMHLLGFIDGHDKFLLNMATGRSELYDLVRDPDELDDQSQAARQSDRVKRYTDTVLTYADWQFARVRDWPALPAAPDVQDLLARDFNVTVIDPNGVRVPCPTTVDGKRMCGGFGDDLYQGIVPITVGGAHPRCLLVAPPPGGQLELEVVDKDYFHLVSMVQATTTTGKRLGKARRDIMQIVVDGAPVTAEGHGKFRRVPLAQPRKSLTLTIDGQANAAGMCLFFSTRAWAPAPAAPTVVDGEDEPPPPPVEDP